MTIELANETPYAVDLDEVRLLCVHVLKTMHIHPEAEVSVAFVSAETMTELHMQWMDLPGTTDVMSFPMDELHPGDGAEGVLGDIVVDPAVAQRQAAAAGHSTMDEILLLVTHGLLHLMGFDHADAQEKREMFGWQRKLLLTWFAEREPGRTTVPEPTED